MRPLVIRYRKLGDTLMVTPILQALADAGADGVYTVGERAWERVFTSHPAVRGNVSLGRGEPSRWELVRAGIRARRFRCDTALVMRFNRRASLVARFAGCKVRVGGTRSGSNLRSGLTANAYDPAVWPDSHQVEKYYAVAELAMGRTLPRLPTLYRPPDDAAVALGLPEAPFAVVHLGSGGSNQGWSDAAYAATVRGLKAMGLPVAVSGAAGDAATYPATREAADLDLVGRTDLDALAGLFQGARLVVGLDGGATRVASAVGTPVVALSIGLKWNPEQIAPWMAPGVLLTPPRHCLGCRLHHCDFRGTTCVESLTAERVLEASREFLSV